jgi:hypothetical protein
LFEITTIHDEREGSEEREREGRREGEREAA